MYAYAVEKRRNIWYIGEKHINNKVEIAKSFDDFTGRAGDSILDPALPVIFDGV